MKIKNYNYEPIGIRIKKFRQDKNYTQEYVAEKLEVSCQHISNIERGLNGISIPLLMDICTVLNADADYILFGVSKGQSDSPISKLLGKFNSRQLMYAEELLTVYAKSCGIE